MGGKKNRREYTCIRFEIPDRRRKIKFQLEFPYIFIYIYIWTVDKFSLLSSRKEDRRIGNQTNCTYRSDICGVQAQLWRKAIIWD